MPHTNDKPLRYRELVNKVKKFGVIEKKRKGSVRILYHPNIKGKPASIPIHPHSEHHEFSKAIVRSVRDRFNISIDEFYSV